MKLTSMSASSVKNWDSCPAYAGATSLNRIPTTNNYAADLGTTCHAALEFFVKGAIIDKTVDYDLAVLLQLYRSAFDAIMVEHGTSALFEDGEQMLRNWFDRQDWTDRTVLSTEQKLEFPLKTSAGVVPFRYIFDRCDSLNDGKEIEVVDYKSWRFARRYDDLVDDKQMRCYGLAAQMQFPQADRIWVTLDQLRYDAVSIVYSREQNVATWHWLRKKAEEIIAAAEPLAERLNPNCRFCPRSANCSTLLKHASVSGNMSIDNPEHAAQRLYAAESAIKALEGVKESMQDFLGRWADENGSPGEFETDSFKVSMRGRQTRSIDPQRAAKVIGPDLFAKYGSITMAKIDALQKSGELTPEQGKQLKSLIRPRWSTPTAKVEPLNAIDAED